MKKQKENPALHFSGGGCHYFCGKELFVKQNLT